ncbi:MAG: hypothetical protein IJU98_08090 [Synergistaceae bacterium]|nr:hypothetical protein [Synergistaceae bacterium]
MSELTGDWDKVANLLNPARMKQKLHQAAARVGNYGASEIKKGITSGAPGGEKFAPLSPLTIARKGSSKPLLDEGDLRDSATYAILDHDNVFIGVKKMAKKKGKDGKEKDLANIAAVHEFGCTIPVTPKMRAYLHHEGIHLKASTQYVNIPARPFLRPIFNSNEFREKIAEIYLTAIKEAFMP